MNRSKSSTVDQQQALCMYRLAVEVNGRERQGRASASALRPDGSQTTSEPQ